MSLGYLGHNDAAASHSVAPRRRLHAARGRALERSMSTGAVCALLALAGSVLVAPTEALAAPFGPGAFAPGSVVVSQGGEIFGGVISSGTGVEANGEVDVYPPDANGDAAPEASFTNGMYGPTTLAFDPSGDLWVANENTSTLVELTRDQLYQSGPTTPQRLIAGSSSGMNWTSFVVIEP